MAARRKQRQLEEKGEYTDSGMSTPSTSGRFGLKLMADYSDLSSGETTRTRMSSESGDVLQQRILCRPEARRQS